MKRINLLYIATAMLLLGACRKAYKDVPTVHTSIATTYPDHFSKREASDVTLTITNTSTGQVFTTKTDAQGRVAVPGLINGAYTVLATKMISADEALELIGVATSFPVNGSGVSPSGKAHRKK